MTDREYRVLYFVRRYIEAKGIAPTYPEIAEALGNKSRGTAHGIVTSLVCAGLLERTGGGSRNLKLPGVSLVSVPTAALQAELERRNG